MPTVCFKARHIAMQPAFTVRLRAPQANWTPHKAPDNCCPLLWVFLRALIIRCWMQQQWMQSLGRGGGALCWWWWWGRGEDCCTLKPHKNSRRICVRGVERSFFHLPGFLCADRQAGGIRQGCLPPYCFQNLLSINSPTAPHLISVTSTTEVFFSYPPPVFLFYPRDKCGAFLRG